MIEVQGETNPVRYFVMLMRSQGMKLNEENLERMAAYCDEPVTQGFVMDAASIAERLDQLCRDSGLGMEAYVRGGVIYCEPSDPIQNRCD